MKFTIRDLFLVTVIVALAVAWWIERTRSERLAEEVHGLEAAGQLAEVLNSSAPTPNPPKP